jgi:hypothetical protein
MRCKSQMLIVTLGIVCAGGANAADLCVAFSAGGVIAGKGFTLPPKDEEKNTCKPFNGVEQGGLFGGVTGTGCVDSQGNTFILHYTYHNCLPNTRAGGSYFESGFCRFFLKEDFPKPGFCRGTIVNSGQPGQYGPQAATLFVCDVDVVETSCPEGR